MKKKTTIFARLGGQNEAGGQSQSEAALPNQPPSPLGLQTAEQQKNDDQPHKYLEHPQKIGDLYFFSIGYWLTPVNLKVLHSDLGLEFDSKPAGTK